MQVKQILEKLKDKNPDAEVYFHNYQGSHEIHNIDDSYENDENNPRLYLDNED